jgi:hypothetical protein
MGRGKHLTGKMEGETEILTHQETLQLLSEQARKGSISAAIALERSLRLGSPEPDIEDELDAILAAGDEH